MLKVFLWFLIPLGFGIPAGVLLAKALALAWPLTAFLYFVSDLVLACYFEPLMHRIIKAAKRSPAVSRFASVMRATVVKQVESYGVNGGPFTLIMVSFGVDPMTGRTATHMAGHGFVSGWAIAITGDMLFYAVTAYATLAVDSWLHDATKSTVAIMVLMIALPAAVKKIREVFAKA